ncbi:hypothetical protein CGLO_01863 [Colletotrichum gloeosporioides Cg-14]|uniref:Uncharacterized protein n=1 Tax=Colletotrichum gloeosporioides (strain Cg-14) TaxID=1237896 RepID=T0M332_COLGC|nr:hypothetical protein CGLO_01863 [Colletotrichum gloeosporioides Cg-14]
MATPHVASEGMAPSSDTNMKDAPADSSTAANPSSTTDTAGSQHPGEASFLPTFDRMSENVLRAAHDAGMGSRMIELTRIQQEQFRCLVVQMDKLTAASEAFAKEMENDRISAENSLAKIKAATDKMRSNRAKAELDDLK